MARKRKRAHAVKVVGEESRKRVKIDEDEQTSVEHPTLCLYYTRISTLRNYLLSRLPSSSKRRRRRVATAEIRILDETLVCTINDQTQAPDLSRLKDFEVFSQKVSLTARSSIGGASTSLPDLIDFAIWLLFHRTYRQAHRPPHMLCHGYQRACNPKELNEDYCAVAGIPGLVSHYPNHNVNTLKNADWTEVLDLLGQEGDRIILDLVLECGVFVAVLCGQGNYCQISGNFNVKCMGDES